MGYKYKCDQKANAAKYYKAHKKKIKKKSSIYYKTYKKRIIKSQRKYYLTHKKRRTKASVVCHRKKRGITSKAKCVNGCKVPWQILQSHHLKYGKKEITVIMCPNCHSLYKYKLSKSR